MDSSIEKFKKYIDELTIELNEKIKQDATISAFKIINNDKLITGSTDNLIDFLVNEYRKTNIEVFATSLLGIKNYLSISDEEWLNNNIIFNEYYKLSIFLDITDLNSRESLNVLCYFVKRDMNKFKKYGISISDREYQSIKPKNISNEEFFDEINKSYQKLQKKANLNESEKKLYDELKNIIDKKLEKPLTIKDEQAIYNHYIAKENIDELDIEIVLQSFKNLGVIDSLIESIKYYLYKELKKQINKEKETVVIKKNKSTYDYNKLANLVYDYIDFTKMMPKRYLSLEERIYCLSILTKMNISKEERRLFLRNCELLSCDIDIITKYIEEYNRLKYYEEQVGLQKEIINMEEIFQELFICNKEDYTFWKSSLDELMKQVESWIPKNYEYEEKEASRLLEK